MIGMHQKRFVKINIHTSQMYGRMASHCLKCFRVVNSLIWYQVQSYNCSTCCRDWRVVNGKLHQYFSSFSTPRTLFLLVFECFLFLQVEATPSMSNVDVWIITVAMLARFSAESTKLHRIARNNRRTNQRTKLQYIGTLTHVICMFVSISLFFTFCYELQMFMWEILQNNQLSANYNLAY